MIAKALKTGNPHLGKRKRIDRIFRYVCFASALVAVLALVVLLGKILLDGIGRLNLSFLTNMSSDLRPETSGVRQALFGTIWLMVLTALISVPIGVAAAVYLEEFNERKNRFTQFIEVNIANLAGVPSIVYGILGLAIFVAWLSLGRSILAGALTMSLLILPIIILVSQESLKAVPSSFREGSLALGTTKWQTIRRMVLPSALPGILTGVILALSRAIGETAPLIVVGAVSYVSFVPQQLSDSYTVLPVQIYNWARQPGEAYHDNAAAAIIVLVGTLLVMNSIAIFIRIRTQKSV
ncbi:MAG: phosphate ABC transporter permease PstA [Fimbriimonadaceae bacterium]